MNLARSCLVAQANCFSQQVTKGNTIAQFLEAVRQQWHELRGIHVDNLMYIKEDLIIPHVSILVVVSTHPIV